MFEMKVKLKICSGCNVPRPIWKQDGKERYCQFCWSKKKEPTTSAQRNIAISKQRTPIKKQSDKRKKEDILYSTMRKQFLKDNPMCFMAIPGLCQGKGTTIQHRKGRGKYYLDSRFWGTACMPCHSYADLHPEESFEKGWAIPRLTNE
jgi:hypothetical protein